MTPQELLAFFIQIAPEFANVWNSENNFCIRDDGTYTLHGVCSEFSCYFTHQESFKETSLVEQPGQPDISPLNIKKLFDFIEDNIYETDVGDELDNALCTCFLENIAMTKAGNYARDFMGEKSKKYYDPWNM